MDALDKACALLEGCETGDNNLSEWEEDFLTDITDRYSDSIQLTLEQESKIDEIYAEKMG